MAAADCCFNPQWALRVVSDRALDCFAEIHTPPLNGLIGSTWCCEFRLASALSIRVPSGSTKQAVGLPEATYGNLGTRGPKYAVSRGF
jgi:hypothetical protein